MSPPSKKPIKWRTGNKPSNRRKKQARTGMNSLKKAYNSKREESEFRMHKFVLWSIVVV